MKKIVSLALALCLCLASVAVLAETTHVKVGVVGENNEQWEQVIIPTLAEEGIEIELVKFSDYIIPNQALANGDVDLNAFQHYDFMEKWSEDYGVELVAVCDTLIAPLCIYSEKYTSLDEIQDGDGIAIMNDVVNEARALRMLEATGLIKLDENITELDQVDEVLFNYAAIFIIVDVINISSDAYRTIIGIVTTDKHRLAAASVIKSDPRRARSKSFINDIIGDTHDVIRLIDMASSFFVIPQSLVIINLRPHLTQQGTGCLVDAHTFLVRQNLKAFHFSASYIFYILENKFII